MKKGIVFILGILVGFLLCYYLLPLIHISSNLNEESDETIENAIKDVKKDIEEKGITVFDEPAEIMAFKSFEVSRVLKDGSAVAYASEREDETVFYKTSVLLLNEGNATYYDKQIIRLKKNQKARHIGTYRHYMDTLPIIRIEP